MLVAILGMTTIAQAQTFNYQGVLRDDDGTVMQDEDLDIVVGYMNGEGTLEVFSESFTTMTNEFGEFNIALFGGTIESGDHLIINFLDNDVYINVEINGTNMGDSPIGSAPIALFAQSARYAQGAEYAADAGEINTTTENPVPNTLYANSGPIAYGRVGGVNIITGYGITSVANPSAGVYEIVCDNSWIEDPVVVATAYNGSSDTEICTYSSIGNGNQITIRVVDENNDPTPSDVSFIIYGIAQ